MADENAESGNNRLQKVVESQAGKLVSSALTPLLIIILGYLIQDKLEAINTTTKTLWTQMGKLSESLSDIKINMAVASQAITAHEREDVNFEDQTRQQLLDHEARIRAREQTDGLTRFKLPKQ